MGIHDNSYGDIENKIRFYHNFNNTEFSNYMEYSKYLIDSLKNYENLNEYQLIKYYLDKFEKCYNYLI